MTEFNVAVTSVLSQTDYGTIFTGVLDAPDHPRNKKELRVKTYAKNTLGWPAEGETWKVLGELGETLAWGWQINAERAHRVMPSGKLICAFLQNHAPGIGPSRADLLWIAFGMKLESVLMDEANIPAISAVIAPDRPTMGPALAAACVRAWKDAAEETRTLVWLTTQGINDIGLARRVGRILGGTAVEQLQTNPYRLVPVLEWGKLDEFAKKLLKEAGVQAPGKDPRRLLGACDAVVKRHIKDGHTAGTMETMRDGLAKLLQVKGNSPMLDAAMALGIEHGAIVPQGIYWRAPGCAVMEDYVFERLRQIQLSTSPVQILPQKTLERLLLGKMVDGKPLHPEQREAVLKVIQLQLSCLQGGAGVGKTTITRVICDLWEECGGKLMLGAIGGKASLRLRRATGRLAMTLARWRLQHERRAIAVRELERDDLPEKDRRKLESELEKFSELTDSHLVLIDESSMLDLASARALLQLMPSGARLLFVGDNGQLPPVGFGLIYHRLVDDPEITARLTVIHRQTDSCGIPMVALAIRKGKFPELLPYAGVAVGVSFIECADDQLEANITKVWNDLSANNAQIPLIVTATNNGDAGIHSLNRQFHKRRVDDLGLPEVKGEFGEWFSQGDPVVFLRNDYGRGLFNGLIGVVVGLDIEIRSLQVLFDGYDEPHEIERDDLIDLQLAYAITCHKGQGSQAPAVIVPIYNTRLLDPSWLYTAVTRAELQVILIGSREILAEALARPTAAEKRMVGFQWN